MIVWVVCGVYFSDMDGLVGGVCGVYFLSSVRGVYFLRFSFFLFFFLSLSFLLLSFSFAS